MQSFKGKEVNIREAKRNKISRFDELMEEFHYIGKSRSVGDSMRMIAEINGEWVGILMWGSASYRLKDRDVLIGWTDVQRAQRQKFIVQNRRFLLLLEKGEHPNLASKILGAAIWELPEMWSSKFGYKHLLAETFTDIEAYEGTFYKSLPALTEAVAADTKLSYAMLTGKLWSKRKNRCFVLFLYFFLTKK